jgi:DNA-binding response OmpR family regulator
VREGRTLLLVEDEPSLAQVVARELSTAGFRVLQARSGEEALRRHESERPDVVVLDWMLPGLDGLEVVRRLRASGASTPVLMLTARAEEADRVVGLEMGADDYLVKPFSTRELLARVRALLRRGDWLRDDRSGAGPDVELGPLRLSPAGHRATLEGVELPLTRLELGALALLARSPGRVISRRYLMETIWDGAEDVSERAVDNVVSRLRRKLGPFGERIEAVWGVGYRMKASGA